MDEGEALATCYGPGSIAGAIIGTLLITLALAGAGLLVYNIYWRSRKGKHLVLVSDVENPDEHYAFDNPNFREATPIKQQSIVDETKSSGLDLSWLGNWSPLQAFSTPRNEKQSLDDTFVANSQLLKVVSLKSHDFTGLGFSVCGNMRDGIFVKDLLHRGPAFESGRISPGDRIDSICISFRHMVFEDALTILSYASPYEVQIQVEQNGVSRPSTLLRKRETSGGSAKERILHPFYRSQSISDLASIQRATEKPQSSEKKASKHHEGTTNDFPTLKLSPSANQRKREQNSSEKKGTDSGDGTELPKHAKFGVRVLPTIGPNSRSHKDNTENEQNVVIEQSLTHRSKEDDGKDVKALITKGIQNIREKINQNTLGRKKKEDETENEPIATKSVNLPKQDVVTDAQIPLEVERAGAFAQNSRKSVSAESLAARRPASEVCVEITAASPVTVPETGHKKSKGKAPAPPQAADEVDVETVKEYYNVQLFERQQTADSDSETESGEMTCTQVTVHHSPPPEESEPNRKAASLGDLSRLQVDKYSGTLERASSLDLDGPHGKKRKAPVPPPEDFPYEDQCTIKEPRLEGLNTFQRRLKKSSDFGRLEDAFNDTSDDSLCTKTLSTEPLTDLSSVAAHKINEFSSWLEEVRKPNDQVKVSQFSFNFTPNTHQISSDDEISNGKHESVSEENSPTLSSFTTILDSNDSGFREISGTATEVISSIISTSPTTDDCLSSESSPEPVLSETDNDTNFTVKRSYELNRAEPDIEVVVNGTAKDVQITGIQVVPVNEQPAPKDNEGLVSNQPTSFTLSVNGMNLQEPSRTVLLISQPNSLELEGLTVGAASPDEETPPRLPTSPPPTTSLSYVTEIQVTTTAPLDHPVPPPKIKPQRKDVTPETSRIPVRTMKSETGQKVLAAIHSLAAKEFQKSGFEVNKDGALTEENSIPSVAGFYLKKVPPVVPPRRSDNNSTWAEGFGKEPVNGTPRRVPMPQMVSLPVKTSATKIIFESQENHEEF